MGNEYCVDHSPNIALVLDELIRVRGLRLELSKWRDTEKIYVRVIDMDINVVESTLSAALVTALSIVRQKK